MENVCYYWFAGSSKNVAVSACVNDNGRFDSLAAGLVLDDDVGDAEICRRLTRMNADFGVRG